MSVNLSAGCSEKDTEESVLTLTKLGGKKKGRKHGKIILYIHREQLFCVNSEKTNLIFIIYESLWQIDYART